MRLLFILFIPCFLLANQCTKAVRFNGKKLELSESEWKKRLTPEQFRILRRGGTEKPYSNDYYQNKEQGIYRCAACHLPLFSSEAKFDTQSGWPSFYEPICPENVMIEKEDISLFYLSNEVLCSRCESHLGDLFFDGPQPTGLRFCINSVALSFERKK
jgi:peptide-methionine (R)-S-oxide reductase